jgi:hypothetical protein
MAQDQWGMKRRRSKKFTKRTTVALGSVINTNANVI